MASKKAPGDNGALWFYAGLIAGALFMVVLWASTYFLFPPLARRIINQDPEFLDAIFIAGQLGRLDFISLLLAIIATLLVFAALPIYRLILHRCLYTVDTRLNELEDSVGERVESKAVAELEERLPGIIQDYVELAKNTAINDGISDDIMRAQEDGDER